MKLLSIAIPCYNSEAYMENCIRSLLPGGDEVEILIVDEILAVGDAQFQEKSKRRMMELMGGGTTVLLVSHDIGQVKELCQRVVWLEHGHVRKIGDAETLCYEYAEN